VDPTRRGVHGRELEGDAVTIGERMLFAVAFDRAMSLGMSATDAAFAARMRVAAIAEAHTGAVANGDDETRAMLDDMLGVKR
jgi:hypothetical protein